MLTVLQVAYPFSPVGPDAIGGAEQIVHQLDVALVRGGHRSILVACEGSVAAGELFVPAAAPQVLDDEARRAAWAGYREAIAAVLRSRRVDVVHLHGIDFMGYLPKCDVPIAATLHLPLDWYPNAVFSLGIRLVCVSASQRRACPPTRSDISVIRNGVSVDRFADGRRRRFSLCLARICPEKAPHLAVDAARRAGVPLGLAGRVFGYGAHEAYFINEVAPLLDRRRRFLGPVGGRRKARLLANAGCLLVPSEVHETSSLVAMEALASGTPVVAFRRGALPEIVEHGRTGFLVEDVDTMASAISASRDLSSAACRAAAREHFTAERMTAEYLRMYDEMRSPS
jgi:glycosyltransferase involved in cell wall biosynthesis